MSKFVNRANFLQILIPVIFILFVSSGCSSNNNDSPKNEDISFQSLFENNPIDKAFEAEMRNSYDILIELLDDDDKIVLETSQKAWDEYIKNIEILNNHIYYLPERKYTILDYNANYMFDLAEATKNRTYELMRWVYSFTGELEFIFDEW